MNLKFLAAAVACAFTLPSIAAPIVVFNQTKTGKRYEYFTPTSSGTATFKGTTVVDSYIVILDLDSRWKSAIDLWTVGTKKYYSVDLAQAGKWTTLEPSGSANTRTGIITHPKANTFIEYSLDSDTVGLPTDAHYSSYTEYLFGIRGSIAVPGNSTYTFAPGFTGFGASFEYHTTPYGSSYTSIGNLVTARNYTGSYKYNTKNTSLVNTGTDVEVNGELLKVGTRGYAAYKIVAGLIKAGYAAPPQ
jgi:hypothetical protein